MSSIDDSPQTTHAPERPIRRRLARTNSIPAVSSTDDASSKSGVTPEIDDFATVTGAAGG
jgi:hypothetical protein